MLLSLRKGYCCYVRSCPLACPIRLTERVVGTLTLVGMYVCTQLTVIGDLDSIRRQQRYSTKIS